MSSYRIGQILYIIPEGNPNLIPVKVRERRLSETEQGTSTLHIIQTPKPNSDDVKLETVKGRIFTDLDEARKVMNANAQRAIEGMIQRATNIAKQVFGQPTQAAALVPQDNDPFDTTGVLGGQDQLETNQQLIIPGREPDEPTPGDPVKLADGRVVTLSS